MTLLYSVNIKLFISQFNKLKLGTENETKLTLKLLSNIIGNSANETNYLHKLLLTDRLVSKLCWTFANNLSANTKLSKTQLSKIIQSGGFLGKLLGAFLKNDLLLMKNVLKPVAKSVL